MAKVYVGSASIDERGMASGGKAGNQSGKELKKQAWYLHKKGWRVFRCKDVAMARKIAHAMTAAIGNKRIGYDQGQRNTLYQQAEPVGFNPGLVTKDCETDCSALVRVCCAYAGITGLPSGFNTSSMAGYLLGTGKFSELKGSKYTDGSAYLGEGDILVTKTKGHTVVVLNNGSKYEGTLQAVQYTLGGRTLSYGCEGDDVKLMQELLIEAGYDLGKWGADGVFGDCTELAVRAFQRDWGLAVNGQADSATIDAMSRVVSIRGQAGDAVVIDGGDCYIRTGPSVECRAIGVAKRNSQLVFAGLVDEDTGWIMVQLADGKGTGWVSPKYGRVI